ncbi:substrate-binding domain-containing protein [Sporomusa sp.]|uniref:substrate-binding domain-containing protein n=1 Tax=Sporomusa sp. TaxID=2078658 RepID=UPI002CB7C5F2|nr:substrate-binding domain-containing protein [Sporomusa sp.]HWR41701.1 substrate-binding domain-containing protein [Sporomusa sp.]
MIWRNKFFLVGILLIMLLALTACGTGQPATQKGDSGYKQILLSSTIGPIDAGIVDALETEFQKKTGIVVRHVGAGTGATLKMAEGGQFDVVLVHAKALEEKFVADGFGLKRYDVMYNDFVLVGSADDPAKVKGEKSISTALKKIMDTKSLFISRGDKSGTHIKEMELWKLAGLQPKGEWYRVYEKGAEGNSKTLKYVDEQNGYTIMDRATYITMKKEIKIQVLVEKDDSMLNFISVIPVNHNKFPSVKNAEAMKFVEWLTSEEGQKVIRDFGKDKYGEPLFFPNSPAGKNLKS